MFGVTGFDIVIGNTPYGAEINKENLKQIKKIITDTNNSNSAALFIDISKNILINQTGVLSFIVPKSLLYSEKWQSLVKVLINKTSILVDVEKAFDNVLLEQVVFIFCNNIKRKNYLARKFINGLFINDNIINIEDSLNFLAWICGVSQAEINLGIKILKNSILMNKISQTTRGLPIQKYLTKNGDIEVIGGKNILRYGIDGIKGFISKENLPQSDKLNLLTQSKIISQRIVAHIENPKPHIKIISSLDIEGNILSVDTVENTILFNNQEFNIKFILALLNSNFINWYAYKFIFCSAIRTMDFDNYYVGKIPIPDILLKQQQPIIKLVDKILEIKKKNPQENTSKLEKEIDLLVYELYGLTEEEIKIVEGK
jgi:hypothetical protein